MNLFTGALLTLYTTFSAIPLVVRGPLNNTTNLTQYPYVSTATNFYRTTENKTIFTPLTLAIDFSDDDTVYDLVSNRFVSNSVFRSNFSGFELSLLSTGGAYRSPAFRYTTDFMFTTNTSGTPVLRIGNTFVNSGTTTTLTTDTPYDPLDHYHTFLIELKFTANGTGSGVVIRWGTTLINIPTPFTTWESTDAADTGHNAAWRMFASGSSRSVSSWSSAGELTEFKFTDFASAEDNYYSDLAEWYYEKGVREADSSAMINGFSAMVGILVNFVLMIANLQVFDISLTSIFAVLVLFTGIVWTLKLIRG